MVLGPYSFSIGARNCLVDQTLSTNKAGDDVRFNGAAAAGVVMLLCSYLFGCGGNFSTHL